MTALDHRHRTHRFTLIELLVVVSIISVLASMLLPVLGSARERARRVSCMNIQKQAFLAMAMYSSDYEEYPATGSRSDTNTIDEKEGYGLRAFSSNGPYRILYDGKYVENYEALQCNARPFPLSDRRNGWQSWGGSFGLGTWFGYNGPNVWGAKVGNNGSNNALLLLGGHHPWVAESWGLSAKEGTHLSYNNYRSGPSSVSDIAFLACPGLVESRVSGQWQPIAQREPHDTCPANAADDYGNTTSFQTDGPIWSNPYAWAISRNYIFGDGHAAFINRRDRAFTKYDQF